MSNVNGVAGDSADIEIRIQISGNTFQEQRYFNNGKPKPKSVPELCSQGFNANDKIHERRSVAYFWGTRWKKRLPDLAPDGGAPP